MVVNMRMTEDGEKRVYGTLVDAGGSFLQRDLFGMDGMSMATVSRFVCFRLEHQYGSSCQKLGHSDKPQIREFSRHFSSYVTQTDWYLLIGLIFSVLLLVFSILYMEKNVRILSKRSTILETVALDIPSIPKRSLCRKEPPASTS